MREVEIKVYKFDELSIEAKDHAYETWLQNQDYFWDGENREELHILKNHGVLIYNWQYDQYCHSYRLDITKQYRNDYKGALDLYYYLTEKRKTSKLIDKLRALGLRYWSPLVTDTCYSGYYTSEVFSRALWESIRNNHDESLVGIVEVAVDKLFESFCSDFRYSMSKECFKENYAYEDEYLESGETFIDY